MSRTREWLKFGVLIAVAALLTVAFVGTVDHAPRPAAAQQATALAALTEPQPAPLQQTALPATATPSLDALSQSFEAVAELIKPAVVFIRAETIEQPSRSRMRVPPGFEEFFRDQAPRVRSGQGTGFIISRDGYILTNNHVVQGATTLTVRLLDRREFKGARVVGRDPATDVAVIKIDATNLPVATLGNSDSVKVGEWVLAVGNPLGEEFSFTVTAGIVSAKGRNLNGLPIESTYRIMDFIQTDAVINPGNSGGPLVNTRGQVIGINSAIASETGTYVGYGFAIPANLARTVSAQLIADGRVHRAILGVSIREATENDAAYVGQSEIRGVVVQDYSSADSPAKKAGIEPGDLITELDGQPVSYVAQLQQAVGFRKPGETVKVTVVRPGGVKKVLPVKLVEAPSDEQVAARSEDTTADTGDRPHATKLGIALEPLAQDAAAQVGNDHVGPHVTDVDLDSPARDQLIPAGNGFGDIITQVNGTRVRTVKEFDDAIRNVGAGQVVSLRVYNPQVPAPNGGSRVVRIRLPN
jgi:serine protease Do